MPTLSGSSQGGVLATGILATGHAPVLVYTVPNNCYAEISSFNLGALLGCTASVWGLPTGQSPSGGTLIMPARPITGHDVLPFNDIIAGGVWPAGWSFWLQSDISSALVYFITGFLR